MYYYLDLGIAASFPVVYYSMAGDIAEELARRSLSLYTYQRFRLPATPGHSYKWGWRVEKWRQIVSKD